MIPVLIDFFFIFYWHKNIFVLKFSTTRKIFNRLLPKINVDSPWDDEQGIRDGDHNHIEKIDAIEKDLESRPNFLLSVKQAKIAYMFGKTFGGGMLTKEMASFLFKCYYWKQSMII
ncbi:hypothetical protein ACJX0J_021081, partial [Zea mays]